MSGDAFALEGNVDCDFDLFKEPPEYVKQEPEATFASHTLRDGQKLQLRLVGHNPLWGHLLWNAGRTVSDYLEDRVDSLIAGKTVLELGAGAGLPSLVCAIKGAAFVVVTDYSDPDLIANLNFNITHCPLLSASNPIVAEAHTWGNNVEKLLAHLPGDQKTAGFDTLILADLLFNHSEHRKLLKTVQLSLRHEPDACALVFFTPYRPWLLNKDLAFLQLARDGGFLVEKVLEQVMEEVLFENDPGDELLRRTVFGYRLSWKDCAS